MKTLVLFIVVAFFASTSLLAQERSELKGPAYKNYKPWKNKTKAKAIYTSNKKANLMGPAYKNYKPWKDTTEVSYSQIKFSSARSGLTGPAYKNYKPWRKENNDESSYVEENDSI